MNRSLQGFLHKVDLGIYAYVYMHIEVVRWWYSVTVLCVSTCGVFAGAPPLLRLQIGDHTFTHGLQGVPSLNFPLWCIGEVRWGSAGFLGGGSEIRGQLNGFKGARILLCNQIVLAGKKFEVLNNLLWNTEFCCYVEVFFKVLKDFCRTYKIFCGAEEVFWRVLQFLATVEDFSEKLEEFS